MEEEELESKIIKDAEKQEHHDIAKIIEERKAKKDDGVIYTLADAKRIFNED